MDQKFIAPENLDRLVMSLRRIFSLINFEDWIGWYPPFDRRTAYLGLSRE
jgi:hypothetical protein